MFSLNSSKMYLNGGLDFISTWHFRLNLYCLISLTKSCQNFSLSLLTGTVFFGLDYGLKAMFHKRISHFLELLVSNRFFQHFGETRSEAHRGQAKQKREKDDSIFETGLLVKLEQLTPIFWHNLWRYNLRSKGNKRLRVPLSSWGATWCRGCMQHT